MRRLYENRVQSHPISPSRYHRIRIFGLSLVSFNPLLFFYLKILLQELQLRVSFLTSVFLFFFVEDSTRDEHAANFLKMCHNDSQSHENHENCGENSLGSLIDGDMAPEEELEEGEIRRSSRWSDSRVDVKVHKRPRAMLGDDEMEMEYSRLMDVRRKKNFVCLERIRGKTVNILEGLELHNGVFSSAEQRTIVDFVYSLQKMGKRGQLMGKYVFIEAISFIFLNFDCYY